ncbi:N-acetyl-gamma-glutamyl-phosphate reductase [bacterium]|nr:N-acetyl-gamma-glutamyl-phosphate reductase [bacterium]
MTKVAIVGASGYTGAELVRLLAGHAEIEIQALTSESFAGQKLNALYPAMGACGDRILTKSAETDLSPENVDLVFLAVPHGESMKRVPELLKKKIKVIDLSGDFRFDDVAVYEQWYPQKHSAPEWIGKAVYGMPELFREKIKGASFVANPGCYVTATVLSLLPLVQSKLVDAQSLIVDAKSGISGAGRKLNSATQFNRISENVVPYKMAGLHQHTPEMEQTLSQASGQTVRITFSPHLVPAKRGIVSIGYGRLNKIITEEALHQMYQEKYKNEPFVRVLAPDAPWPDLSSAVGSNMCVIKAAVDSRTQTAVVCGAADNLIKGASGQAIQNMNLMLGLPEISGLSDSGLIP